MNPNNTATHPKETNSRPGSSSRNMDPAEAPGDTQPVSQSVYDSIIRQNGESMHGGFSETGADGATLMTLHEGDSGHIDLLADFDSARQDRNPSPDNDEDSNYDQSESSPLAYQPEFFPESQRFLTTTPGTAVKKNQTPGTTSQTPSVSRNPLAGDIQSSGGLMGLSQVFKATQAPSSPLVPGQQPELVSDRPSPNVPIQQARIATNVSSPLMKQLPVNFESSEPNLNYISMKESQTRRDKSLGERLTRSAENMPQSDQIDDEFYKESSFVENARRQRQINEETAAQFSALNGPSPSKHHPSDSPVPGARQEDDVQMAEAAGSEEETEQEDDLGPQVPQSQEFQSSEEDKENYNGPPAPAIGTSSAHDRLSQALALDSNNSFQTGARPDGDQDPVSLHDQYSGRSSQVMVKDSQQSPQPSPKENQQQTRVHSQSHDVRLKSTPAVEIGRNSPVRRSVRSSPPVSRPEKAPSPQSNTNTADGGRQPMPLQDQQVSNEPRPIQSSNPSEQSHPGSFPPRTQSGTGEKASSMASRVNETPLHERAQLGDMARLTSIPETSPNRTQSNEWEGASNGEGANNEDDDLPPMFPAGNSHRLHQLRPSHPRALSSPIKALQSQAQSQILSSPSGRQRRALTEIASDCSPQAEFRMADLGVEFFTAEDEQFNSIVGDESPTRPKKRRRGNLGQSFNTSDTAVPATPRAQPPKTVAPIQGVPSPAKPQSPAAVHVPATTARRQARPPRRTENVWEIESSPQQPVPRRRSRSRYNKSSAPRRIEEERQPSQVQEKKKAKALARPVVVIHNTQPASSSELTEVDSDDILPSDSTTLNSPPTTPRPPQTTSDNRQIAPSQVLAVWMGQKRAYYPATCFGTPLGVSKTRYSVKFEDSLPVEVVKGAVKRLELHVGDSVKVDMRDVPKVTHIVRGFEDKLSREELARAADNGIYPQTDIYGHQTVVLGPKQRKSLPNGGLGGSENVIKVPISRIYLDTILWNQLKDRTFTYQPETAQETTAHTPSEKSSLPGSPSARFSRSIQAVSGIFANMAFAVSYKEDEATKNRITRLIEEHGGSILHDGFTELFEPSSILPHDTPTKDSSAKKTGSTGMRLTALAESAGFTCLIADTHSRREKYMQALALNLPCLSGRWVEDCVAKGRVLDWDIYLLPAGDSMYLNGATKSRVMAPTSPSEAKLSQTISSRPKLLDGKSVLIITGRGKAEEKRKAYIFLTFALGAARVERVPDLETARALIESQTEACVPCNWDLIYVDDSDQASAKSMLTPRPKSQRVQSFSGSQGRKRKKSTVVPMSGGDLPTPARVVGNEFVCQSLILGRLFEE